MAFHRDPDAGRKATVWLAVAFTLTCGAGVCSFIILAFAESARHAFFVLAGLLVGILLMLWGISAPRDRNLPRHRLLFWTKEKEQIDAAATYQPRPRRHRKEPGGNQPPTVESVREIAQQNVRWVPHGPAPRRDRPER
jgi:hypothetical protein